VRIQKKDQTFPVTTQQIYAYHTLVGVIMIIKSEPYENTIDGTALKWEKNQRATIRKDKNGWR
jgi:hypothetical protein